MHTSRRACVLLASTAGLIVTTGAFELSPSSAQQVQSIVAIVNDDVISSFDVQQRVNLVLSSSGVQPDQDIIQQVREQVLRTLIDEKLQLQEAERFEVEVTEEEIQESISRLAQQNDFSAEAIEASLREAGISFSTLLDQIKAEIAWNKLVSGLLSSRVSVTKEEVDQVLDQLKSSSNKTQYLVAEIFLEVDSLEQEEDVRQGGLQLIQQMQEGVPFTLVAQQFSAAASAAQGGDIGWVQEGELAPQLNEALRRLQPGQVSPPIRTIGGFTILALRDRRILGGPDPMQSTVDLRQIAVPANAAADATTIENIQRSLQQIRSSLSDCGNIENAMQQADGATVTNLGVLKMGQLSGAIAPLVASLQPGEATQPFRTDTNYSILVVCDREDSSQAGALPTRVDIENRLFDQQLSMQARRYLRDLRRDSTIEIR